MRWGSLFLLLLVSAASLVGCADSDNTDRSEYTSVIDWVDFVKLDGITYQPVVLRGVGRTTIDDDLRGYLHGVVAQRLSGTITDPRYRSVDGDASFLPKGARIYEIEGYAPSFRVAAEREGELLLYEAFDNPTATHGRDVLDIEGKVTRISVNEELSTSVEPRVIEDPATVDTLVGLILDAPIVEVRSASRGPEYPLVFHLVDGTTVRRLFRPSIGILVRGIELPPEFADILEANLTPLP